MKGLKNTRNYVIAAGLIATYALFGGCKGCGLKGCEERSNKFVSLFLFESDNKKQEVRYTNYGKNSYSQKKIEKKAEEQKTDKTLESKANTDDSDKKTDKRIAEKVNIDVHIYDDRVEVEKNKKKIDSYDLSKKDYSPCDGKESCYSGKPELIRDNKARKTVPIKKQDKIKDNNGNYNAKKQERIKDDKEKKTDLKEPDKTEDKKAEKKSELIKKKESEKEKEYEYYHDHLNGNWYRIPKN